MRFQSGKSCRLSNWSGVFALQIPYAPLFISVGTLAGRGIAEEKLRPLVDGVFYAPLDFVFVIRRVLRRLRPSVVVIAETEIWPNLFREVKRAGCGLIMVNGRISDRAAPRYVKWRWFFRHALRWPDAILAQNAALRERFVAIGRPAGASRSGREFEVRFPAWASAAGRLERSGSACSRPRFGWRPAPCRRMKTTS